MLCVKTMRDMTAKLQDGKKQCKACVLKQSILIQKLLKAHCIMKKMHEYEMKSFSKILEFNPDLPKTKFSINLTSKRKH